MRVAAPSGMEDLPFLSIFLVRDCRVMMLIFICVQIYTGIYFHKCSVAHVFPYIFSNILQQVRHHCTRAHVIALRILATRLRLHSQHGPVCILFLYLFICSFSFLATRRRVHSQHGPVCDPLSQPPSRPPTILLIIIYSSHFVCFQVLIHSFAITQSA